MISKQHSFARKAVFFVITAGLLLLLFELLASTALIYRYRSVQSNEFYKSEPSFISSVNLLYKAALRLGLIERAQEFRYKSEPSPFRRPDPVLGVRAAPGVYTHTFFRMPPSENDWQSLKVKVTINEDGSRWTGMPAHDDRQSVYILGDSFVFGAGVNDEQTFAYLVQQARRDLNVRLFAFGGFGLTEAYLRFEQLKHDIRSDDVIVLGYADYYDERTVKSPSWLKTMERFQGTRFDGMERLAQQQFQLARANVLVDGSIEINYIHEDCSLSEGYCEQLDPPRSEMTRVSAALINHIADNTSARVFLLHFEGNPENPVFELLSENVVRLSALNGDFDYFIRDDIEGFDPHPGPYWHYAISRKVLEALGN